MKTLFNQSTRNKLIYRINSIDQNNDPLWGKMNSYQMTKHCTIWNEWVLGKNSQICKQEFLGKIFGKITLKSNTKDDSPLGKSMPAGRFIVNEKEGNTNVQKRIWTRLIDNYQHFSNDGFIHDFFGKMTKEQIGVFAYKHNHHHLRQFGV